MLTIGKLALTIVPAGGILLGAVLGEAAHPVMKQPPELPWRGAPDATVATGDPSEMAQAMLADFDPAMGPDSYAPAFANDELHDWEPDYPTWSYSNFSEDVSEAVEEPVIAFEMLPLSSDEAVAPQAEPQQVDSPPADGLAPIY